MNGVFVNYPSVILLCQLKDTLSICIVLGLCMPQFAVFALFIGKQLFMTAALHNISFVKNGNPSAKTARGKPMADIDCGFSGNHFVEMRINFRFRNRIQCSGRFIQNHKRRVLVKRTGKCDFLRFAAGNFNSRRIKALIDTSFNPLRKCFDSFSHARFL